jgi:alpha-beta hydrolase superfamily lysophospholipase
MRLRTPPELESWGWSGLAVRLARRPVEGAEMTCVVLHGGGGNSELVAPILVALEHAGVDAVAPDLPGYGHTDVPRERFTYDTWVECVRSLLRAEAARGGRPVAVFGLSMGGMLGFHAAARVPEVAGLAASNLLDVLDPAVRAGVARPSALGRFVGLMRPSLDRVTLPIRWLCDMRAIANDPALAEACATDPRGGGSRVPLGFLRTWFRYRPEVEPERFDCPVLLAHPGADRWTPPALSERFFGRLGGPKRMVLLENCGHAPIEEPSVTTLERELSGFLASLAATAPSGGASAAR